MTIANRLRLNEEAAWSELREWVVPMVRLNFAGNLSMRDPHLVDTAVNSSLMEIRKLLPNYEERGQFRAWARNVIFWVCKREGRNASSRIATTNQGVDEIPADSSEPVSTLLREEFAVAIAACLKGLNGFDRRVIHAVYWDELALAELGAELGRPIGTIKSDVYRARSKIKRCLGLRFGYTEHIDC